MSKKPGLNNISKIVNLWLPVFVWAIIIFSFSTYQTPSVSEIHWQDFVFKKTLHLIEYGVLAILLFRGMWGSGIDRKSAFYFSFFAASLYGLSDEFHQSFTPGREPKLRDVLIDSVGAFIALYIVKEILPKANPKFVRLAAMVGLLPK